MTTQTSITIFGKALAVLVAAIFAVSAFAGDKAYKMKKKDIVDTAVAAGSFNTLAQALTEADLIDTLKGEGPFTVFAPTDEAFAKIPADQLNAILADKELLTSILTYHVVAGKVMAKDVVKLDSATSLQGSSLAVSSNDGVRINDASVIQADIKTSNGVIHVIDTVLVPETRPVSKAGY